MLLLLWMIWLLQTPLLQWCILWEGIKNGNPNIHAAGQTWWNWLWSCYKACRGDWFWLVPVFNWLSWLPNLVICCKLSYGFNRADLRNVDTEAGMSAICAERDCVMHEDFMKVNPFFHSKICSDSASNL